jgi:hypothetical protein
MKLTFLLTTALSLASLPFARAAAEIPRFYGDAPDAHHPWAVHDPNRPQPKVVTPGTFSSAETPGKPPSDAVVLFDGTDLSHWEAVKDGSAPKWLVKDGILEVEPKSGAIRSKDKFGDCQLHVEWAAPSEVKGESQERGNSGVFLMGLVEIQVLDSFHNVTYADGHAASVYGASPPMVNAVRPPGEFQAYDIIFRRPIYEDGQLVDPGYVTIFLNGVLVQDHTRLEGPTGHMTRARPEPFPASGSLVLQDHNNPTRFRNIWYRELAPRPIEGGTDGYLTVEAAMVKRKEIASDLRRDAEHLHNADNPLPELLRLMESLVYDNQSSTAARVGSMARAYVDSVKDLPDDQLESKKDDIKQVSTAFKYLARFRIMPSSFAPAVTLDKIIKDHGWDKKKTS